MLKMKTLDIIGKKHVYLYLIIECTAQSWVIDSDKALDFHFHKAILRIRTGTLCTLSPWGPWPNIKL
jgi:hypothetical protein